MRTNHGTYAAAGPHGVVISERFDRASRVFKVTGFPPGFNRTGAIVRVIRERRTWGT
jgi:hypothetical protein